MTILRHLFSILLLPFVIVVIVPRWLLRVWSASDTRWVDGAVAAAFAHITGVVVFLCGFALFAWCISLFARVGEGTLAPWDPTRRLVAVGPYRYMRNPMITGWRGDSGLPISNTNRRFPGGSRGRSPGRAADGSRKTPLAHGI